MKNLVPWMFTLTIAVCFFFIILLLGACQTIKKCREDCARNIDNIPMCEEVCEN